MAKRSRRNKGGDQAAQPPATQEVTPAVDPVPAATGKCPAAALLGHKGGLKGGPARACKLTQEQRSAIARKAALARWDRHRQT